MGVGIYPDKHIEPTIKDLRAGRDTVLEAALDEVEGMMPLATVAGGL